jgi:hypothetical protein
MIAWRERKSELYHSNLITHHNSHSFHLASLASNYKPTSVVFFSSSSSLIYLLVNCQFNSLTRSNTRGRRISSSCERETLIFIWWSINESDWHFGSNNAVISCKLVFSVARLRFFLSSLLLLTGSTAAVTTLHLHSCRILESQFF